MSAGLSRKRLIPGFLGVGLLLSLGFSLGPISAQETTLKDLARSAGNSVVLLEIYDHAGRAIGSGTGFYVGPGMIATNHHVIERASRLNAILQDGSGAPVAAVLAEDPVHDLALLAVPEGPPPLPLFRGQVETGEDIAVIGSPRGLAGTLSTGIVSAVRVDGLAGDGLPGPILQISAPISKGSSGSPVMNLRGEVIGVAVAVFLDGQNLNFAVPIQKLFDLERTIDPSSIPVRVFGEGSDTPRKVALGRNLVISIVIFSILIVVLRRLR